MTNNGASSDLTVVRDGPIVGFPDVIERAKEMNWDAAPQAWLSATEQAVAEAEAPYQPRHPSGIEPTEFKALILQDKIEEKTPGGVIIPDDTKERDQYAAMTGGIVAASPLAFTYENWPQGARKPAVGDKVVFAKFAGATVKGRDGVEYRLVNDRDICAILTE